VSPKRSLPQILEDDYQGLAEIARNEYGGLVTMHSVRRWVVDGVGQPRVKLPAIRLGTKYFVKIEDARKFWEAIQDPALHAKHARNTVAKRVKKAKKRLAKAGA
jgi:hypothetical protein